MRRRFTCSYEIDIHNNEIWYTSTDSSIIIPSTTSFGANIVSNTYLGGKGIITFDGTVTEIGSSAFYECTSLKSIIIPESVTEIGNEAFSRCSSLANTTIPTGVVSIGSNAFRDCINLKRINISDSVTTIGNSAFAYCSSLTSITIPDSVTTIGEWAFNSCTSLTSVTMGNGVNSIGSYAFYECTSLTSVTIPDSVTSIEGEAFANCTSLKEFKGNFAADGGRCLIIDGVLNAFAIGCGVTQYAIPDSVTTIGAQAFGGCKSLTSVTIPDSVTTIVDYAFYNCLSLTSVYCKATTPPTLGKKFVFYHNGSDRKIYVPAASSYTYKRAANWSGYANDIVGYDFENDTIV